MVNNCGNCRFFETADKNTGNGVCRRYPPVLVVNAWGTAPVLGEGKPVRLGTSMSEVQSMSGQFAPTHRDLWCGEHQEVYEKKDTN